MLPAFFYYRKVHSMIEKRSAGSAVQKKRVLFELISNNFAEECVRRQEAIITLYIRKRSFSSIIRRFLILLSPGKEKRQIFGL